MTDRPRILFLISIWAWIQTSLLMSRTIGIVQVPEAARSPISSLVGLLGVILGVTLFQMRPRARTIALFVFALSSVNMLRWLVMMWTGWLVLPSSSRAQLIFVVGIALNLLCLRFLVRSDFRDACIAYRRRIDELKMTRGKLKPPRM